MPSGEQVAVSVIGVIGRKAADRARGVFIDVIRGVGGRHTVYGLADAIAGRVVDVLNRLVRQEGRIGRDEYGADQLAVSIVGIGPGAVLRGIAEHVAQGVVRVIVVRIEGRVIGRQIRNRQHFAIGVVTVRGAGPVAVVLLDQVAGRVIRVLNDQVSGAVGELLQPAQGVVLVVDRVAGLVDHLCPLGRRRCR